MAPVGDAGEEARSAVECTACMKGIGQRLLDALICAANHRLHSLA